MAVSEITFPTPGEGLATPSVRRRGLPLTRVSRIPPRDLGARSKRESFAEIWAAGRLADRTALFRRIANFVFGVWIRDTESALQRIHGLGDLKG